MNIKFYNEILHDRLQAHHKVTVAKIATEAEHRNAESEGLRIDSSWYEVHLHFFSEFKK